MLQQREQRAADRAPGPLAELLGARLQVDQDEAQVDELLARGPDLVQRSERSQQYILDSLNILRCFMITGTFCDSIAITYATEVCITVHVQS